MTGKKLSGASEWVDPDDAPELTAEDFDRAEIRDGAKLVRRGRPPAAHPKRLVSLRLDEDVLDGWKRTGAGWQSRINAVLREALRRA
jgi:uncharacterized protein (DUF4415 family)